jgi:Tfp pilus assembly protein PilF
MPAQSPLKRTSGESLQLGLVHQQSGRLHEAEAGYREILEREPRHPDALHLLGVIAQQQGQYQPQLSDSATPFNRIRTRLTFTTISATSLL